MTMDELLIKAMQEKLEKVEVDLRKIDFDLVELNQREGALRRLDTRKRAIKHGLIEALEAMGVPPEDVTANQSSDFMDTEGDARSLRILKGQG